MFVVKNISDLNKLKNKSVSDNTSKTNKKRIDEVIKLYTQRKISNVATAENLIKGLTSSNKKTYDKTLQKYNDNIKKFKDAKPLKERMGEAKKRNQKNTYFVPYVLYWYFKGDKKDLEESGIKQKPAFIHQGVYYFTTSFSAQSATIKVSEFPREIVGKRIFRWEDADNIPQGDMMN